MLDDMEFYQTTVSLIRGIVWPALVLLFVIRFRVQIGEAIGRIRHVEAPGGWSADLTQTAIEAERISRQTERLPASSDNAFAKVDLSEAIDMVANMPGPAIARAWGILSVAASDARKRLDPRFPGHGPLRQGLDSIRQLVQDGHLDHVWLPIADSLWDVFIKQHDKPDTTPSDALVYINTVEPVLAAVQRIAAMN